MKEYYKKPDEIGPIKDFQILEDNLRNKKSTPYIPKKFIKQKMENKK